MSNTSFCFRHRFLLSAHSSQSHATSCLSLMFHHWVNNKCNRVKGRHWRWLIYALRYLISKNMLHFFRSNHYCSWKFYKFQRKTHVLESLFSLKWWNHIRHLICINTSYFCQIFFLTGRHHKRLKNTTDLLLLYREHFYEFSESNLWKRPKKSFHFTTIISIYTGHKHFEVLWSFILYILQRFALSLRNSSYGYIPLYMHNLLPTLGNEKEKW